MRVLSFCVLCAFLAALPVRADEATKRVLAEELLTAMDIQKNTEKSFEMMKKMIVSQSDQAAKMAGTPAASTNIAAESGQMLDLIMKEMSWEKLKEMTQQIMMDLLPKIQSMGGKHGSGMTPMPMAPRTAPTPK